jgi:hypothetical protein
LLIFRRLLRTGHLIVLAASPCLRFSALTPPHLTHSHPFLPLPLPFLHLHLHLHGHPATCSLLLLCPACDLCAYTCRRNDNLMLHRRTVHARERPFHCHLCDYRAAQVWAHIPLEWMSSAKNM